MSEEYEFPDWSSEDLVQKKEEEGTGSVQEATPATASPSPLPPSIPQAPVPSVGGDRDLDVNELVELLLKRLMSLHDKEKVSMQISEVLLLNAYEKSPRLLVSELEVFKMYVLVNWFGEELEEREWQKEK